MDEASCLGEVERGITDLGEKNCVDLVIELEVGEDLKTFGLRRLSVDEGLFEFQRVGFQRVDIIREDNDFIAALFVVVNKELARLKPADPLVRQRVIDMSNNLETHFLGFMI